MPDIENLKNKIIEELLEQGFKINPHVRPAEHSKDSYRKIQQKSRLEQIMLHKKFLADNFYLVKSYCRDGRDIKPENIELELREVQSGKFEEILFKWWNFVWWSIPYQRSYGRQMRFVLWDKTHEAPFGLICLQSPVLRMSVRDRYLEIPKEKLDLWVNRSMSAQRVGALPPYNDLLGGKMVALSLTSNEIRKAYEKKYKGYVSLIKERKLSNKLLFITTTSAFGKSSLYNRLKYKQEKVAESLGFTKGSGTFHISETLYEEIILYLKELGYNIARGYGNGPSRKLKLISMGLKHIGIPNYTYHNIKREFYIFPLVKNLKEVIHNRKKTDFYNRPMDELLDFWKERWALPRSERNPDWNLFRYLTFFDRITLF